ncbi:FAD-dependent oxidoreductase [Paenibacillus sp. FA6]|uniref:FAD-dependent oxidoreductase n=1 Tax=Paenibacillus sp. FA6 TaxID=3413029 RepID=UPI003F658255
MKSTIRCSRYLVSLIIMAFIVQWISPYTISYTVEAKSSCGSGCSRYDVVVIGSEIQGALLAKEAHQLGLKVLILDPRSKQGGQLIQGQMYVLDEPNDKKGRSLVQGDIKKLFDGYKAGTIRKDADFNRYFQSVIKNIPLRSGIVIESVNVVSQKQDKSLKSITYRAKDGVKYTVEAEYFVDNSDFNALTSHLDVKRIPGMESIYNGSKPDYMAATLVLNFKNVNWSKLHQAVLQDYPLTNVREKYGPNTYVDWNYATGFSNITYKYKPLDPQFVLRGINSTYQKDGQVVMNALLIFDVDPADPKSIESAIKKGKAEAPLILKYLRKNIPGYAKAELNGFPEYLYIRDYNRFETEYILDYPDLMSSKMFWDNVSIASYGTDLQATTKIPKGHSYGHPDRYGIPLRSFELKSYENVLVVGSNIGATIKAYGSARIMPNTALAGQTIGIILGKELKNKRLRELTPADFVRIHKYLQKDYRIALQS